MKRVLLTLVLSTACKSAPQAAMLVAGSDVAGATVPANEPSAAVIRSLAPPEPGTPEIAEGFELFVHQCATCHSIDGHGGKAGPELNAPHSVTEYWQPQSLHQWLDNPQSIRKGAAGCGIPARISQRQRAIDNVIAYLKAMTHGP